MNNQLNELINRLPDPESEILAGVKWGRCDHLFTPAYWKVQYQLHESSFGDCNYRTSNNLIHEICACILGGFGIKAEMAMMAFQRLKERKLLEPCTTYDDILSALLEPLIYNGSGVRYRFPYQKAKYLFKFLERNDINEISNYEDLDLRTWLLTVNGIGMKTASWIVRNWLSSTNVAILDIHIHRAGIIAGLFDLKSCIQRSYLDLERKYLDFCSALDVNAANLDALIWLQLKTANFVAINTIKSMN